jgi:hypothetical protein
MGNRGGRFHDEEKRIGARRWATRQWIACVCVFKDRRREVFGRGYTELFFRDEPTALAAGHRPCFECRRAEALAFQSAFPGIARRAPEMDAVLHEERLGLRRTARLGDLPEGAMVLLGAPHLWAGDKLWPWSFGDYGPPAPRPEGPVVVLTPPSIVAALKAGYRPRAEGTPL